MIVGFYLDTSHPKKNGLIPVKLRITVNGQQKYFKTDYATSEEDWKKVFSAGARGDNKIMKNRLDEFQRKAEEIIESMKVFSWNTLSRRLYAKDIDGIEDLFREYIAVLYKDGKEGTAQTYESALKSFTAFGGLSFDIDADYLNKYEHWMLTRERKRSITTVGIHMRSLRNIMNIARERQLTTNYPFGKRAYVIPASRNIKKALTKVEVDKIKAYKPKNEAYQRAIDYWLFSYYAHGMNFKDITVLKKTDIQGDILTYTRAKTSRTTRSNIKKIRVWLRPELKAIIKRQGVAKGELVFPFDKFDIEKRRQFIKTTNDYMNRVGKELKFTFKLTTYVARHSWSTILKNSGANKSYIQEAGGWQTEQAMESYFDGFPKDYIKEMAERT